MEPPENAVENAGPQGVWIAEALLYYIYKAPCCCHKDKNVAYICCTCMCIIVVHVCVLLLYMYVYCCCRGIWCIAYIVHEY